ncbi:hypothetical protein [Levilactobacillus yonginensis]|uniref:hypothetical protein n=1 Tax=Levilactobacillus yonginensis TaxID=1054041 RepID=UPI00345DFAD7
MKVRKHWLIAIVALLAVGGLAGCSSGVNDQAKNADQASSSNSSNAKTAKDESILKEAQELNADGKYKKSNQKLSTIDLADLNKKGFGTLKTEFFNLQKSNDKFLLKKSQSGSKTAATNNGGSTTSNTAPTTNNSFNSYGKFTGDYYFYNDDDGDRQQSSLTINSDGTVIQNNNDGSAFHGSATVKSSGETGVLSYDVTSDTNDTKSINANVEVDVVWSNGEHETYYGYMSYDGDSVLTDGKSYDGDLVNEVWVHY